MFSNDPRDPTLRRRARANRRASYAAIVERLEARMVMTLTPTATSLVVSASRIGFGQPVDLTATVSSAGPTINGGTVAFRAGPTVLGTAPVVNGTALLSVPTLGVGNYQLTAAYSGISDDLLPSVSGVDGSSPIRTIAGSGSWGFSGDGGAATSASLNYPANLAVDAAGNVYFVDNGNNRIRKVATDGTISTVAGTGVGGFSGDGGAATSAQLSNPYSIAVDAAGNIFIGDDGNNRIRKVDARGTITTYAGTGTSGYSGDGGPATLARLRVASMAVDAAGTVYFTDQGNGYVRKITPDGIITTIAGNGTSGYSGDGGPGTSAQIRSPYGVGVDAAGNVYFAEISNHVIRRVTPQGIISTYAGTGVAGSTGDGGQATLARLSTPGGMAVDASGNVFFNQFGTNQVRKVAPDGIITTIAGTGTAGYSGDGGPSTSAQLNDTEGLGIDAAGNLYLADSSNNVIRRVDGPAALVVTAATTRVTLAASVGSAVLGGPVTLTATVAAAGASVVPNDGTATFRDGGTVLGTAPVVDGVATLQTTALPLGRRSLTVSYAGSASFQDGSTAAFSPTSPIDRVAGDGTAGYSGDGGPATSARLNGPREAAFDAAGNLYIADEVNFRIRKVSPDGTITTVAGDGNRAYSGDGGPATRASIGITLGLALDPAGNLYFTDAENHRIRKVAPDGIISTIAGTGTRAATGDGGPAIAAAIDSPTGLVIDAAGNLYFGDGSGRIRKVATDGIITTVAGNGTAGYAGDGGAATSARIGSVYSLDIDAAGNLYFGDTAYSVVRKVGTDGIITTVAGDGVRDTSGSFGDDGLATRARLDNPSGVAVDAAGNVFIQDGRSLRMVTPDGLIRRLDGDGSASLGSGGGPVSGATIGDLVGLSVDNAGNLVLATYSSGAVYSVARREVVVDVTAEPASYRVTTSGPATAGAAQAFTVTAVDAQGQPVLGYNGSIRLSSSDPDANLPVSVAVVNGVATFDATLRRAGPAAITAQDNDLPLSGSTMGLTVSPAAAAIYGFTVATEGQPAGGRLVTVTAFDAFGNVATGYAGTANVTTTDPNYRVPATITFVAGRASFTGAVGIPDIPTITVTDADAPDLAGTLAGEVTPSTAARFAVAVSSTGVAGAASLVTVTALDDRGNLVSGFNGPITLTSSDGRAVFPAGASLVNGVATFDVGFRTAGVQTLTARAIGDASLSGSASAILVTPAAASRVVVAIDPASVAGQPSRVTVTALDDFGNVATDLDGPISLISSDPRAVLPADIALAGGSASFDVSFRTAGTQTLTASGGIGAGLRGTSAGVTVSPADAVVTPPPASATSSLGGVIFDDADGDGSRDPGEAGLADVPIILEGADADGNPVRLSLATNADGSYRFAGLRPGTYSLSFPGSTGIAGSLGGRPAPGRVDGIVLGDGVDGLGYTFAARAAAPPTVVGADPSPSTGRLAGTVYLDRNRNGVYDAGRDLGIARIRVILTGVDDRGRAVRKVTTTDAAGAYLFAGLRPGSYSVRDGRTRVFRETRAGTRSRHRVSAEAITAAVEAGSTSRVDFGKLPFAGFRLARLVGPDGIDRPVPRGPLTRRFFPIQAAARIARPSPAKAEIRPQSGRGPTGADQA